MRCDPDSVWRVHRASSLLAVAPITAPVRVPVLNRVPARSYPEPQDGPRVTNHKRRRTQHRRAGCVLRRRHSGRLTRRPTGRGPAWRCGRRRLVSRFNSFDRMPAARSPRRAFSFAFVGRVVPDTFNMSDPARPATNSLAAVVRLADRRPPKRTPLRRKSALRRTSGLTRSTALSRVPLPAASEEQQRKVDGRGCLVCRGSGAVDPAHLVPRSRGGCDHPDCVVPLCRRCHRAFDDGRLDLLPYLEPHRRAELAHALQHLGLIELLERVTAERWAALERAAA